MEQKSIPEIKESLKKRQKNSRYEHTLGVMYTAAAMAMAFHMEPQKALLAGALHDCGKYGTNEEQLMRCQKHQIALTEAEMEIPALVHAKLGVYYAKNRYGITDEEILRAIRYHTTGRPEMSDLEKIVYLADYIEPGRKSIPNLPDIRQLAFQDLNKAVAVVSGQTLSYLESTGGKTDPATLKTWEYYKNYENGSSL